jgi:protein-S-isoprenylcysteine O-methyltransferase Ste14
MSKTEPSTKEWESDTMSVQRGDYTSSMTIPKLVLIGFRLLSPYVQYSIMKNHPLGMISSIPPPPTGGTFTFSPPSIPALGLSSAPITLPIYQTLMTAMPTALALNHTYWLTCLIREKMTLPFAFFGGLADLIYETVSTLVFTGAAINPLFNKPNGTFYLGTALYFSAVIIEKLAENQRARFKADPANKGKVCDKGLWGWVRHPNYTANVVFGFGYGLASGGIGYALCTGGMYASNLSMNAGPSLEDYMKTRYGAEWEGYKGRVRWQMFPGIF